MTASKFTYFIVLINIALLGFFTTNVFAQESQNSIKPAIEQDSIKQKCESNKTRDIQFAQNRVSLRSRQIETRLNFAKNKISLANTLGKDTAALQNLIPEIEAKTKEVKVDYSAWVEAAKKIDCTTIGTLQETKNIREKAHAKAWTSFKDFIIYYDKTVRPIYRTIASSASNSKPNQVPTLKNNNPLNPSAN